MMVRVIFFILLSEIWNTAGQIFFKKGTNALEVPHLKNFQAYLEFMRNILKIPAIWLGLSSMAVGLVIWLIALSQGDLSFVFPIGSLQYILILLAARIFLGEKIDRMKLLGTLLVTAGIILITLS